MALDFLQTIKSNLDNQARLAAKNKSQKLTEIRIKRAINAIDMLSDHVSSDTTLKELGSHPAN